MEDELMERRERRLRQVPPDWNFCKSQAEFGLLEGAPANALLEKEGFGDKTSTAKRKELTRRAQQSLAWGLLLGDLFRKTKTFTEKIALLHICVSTRDGRPYRRFVVCIDQRKAEENEKTLTQRRKVFQLALGEQFDPDDAKMLEKESILEAVWAWSRQYKM